MLRVRALWGASLWGAFPLPRRFGSRRAAGAWGAAVDCHIDYGGETRTLRVAGSARPLAEPAHEVEGGAPCLRSGHEVLMPDAGFVRAEFPEVVELSADADIRLSRGGVERVLERWLSWYGAMAFWFRRTGLHASTTRNA